MSSSEKVYCGFCRLERSVYSKKHITSINVVLSFAAAVLGMLILWQTFDPRVILLLVVGLALSEAFVQVRWRLAMTCQHCGFDPILYIKDQRLAVKKVKARLESYRTDTRLMLKKENPLLELQDIQRKISKNRAPESLGSRPQPDLEA